MIASWIQLSAGLVRGEGGALASARVVFSALAGTLIELRNEGRLGCFFFMRKPPDLRLRFGLASGVDPGAVTSDLRALFGDLERRKVVSSFFESIYEPETRQFGGPQAMDAVHLWFDADTRGWIQADALVAEDANRVEPAVLSLAVINDLFARTLGDHGEIWDCWANLADLVAGGGAEPGPALEPIGLKDLEPRASAAELEILARYDRANLELARELQQIASSGQLTAGLRGILPFVAWFHYNRYGFGPEIQARLAAGMTSAWSLKRGLRGADGES